MLLFAIKGIVISDREALQLDFCCLLSSLHLPFDCRFSFSTTRIIFLLSSFNSLYKHKTMRWLNCFGLFPSSSTTASSFVIFLVVASHYRFRSLFPLNHRQVVTKSPPFDASYNWFNSLFLLNLFLLFYISRSRSRCWFCRLLTGHGWLSIRLVLHLGCFCIWCD